MRSKQQFVLLLLVANVACYNWRQAAVSPVVLLSTEHPSLIRVTLPGARRVLLGRPQVLHDTIRAWELTSTYRPIRPISLPLSGLQVVETQHLDADKTVAAASLGGLGIALVIVAIHNVLNICPGNLGLACR